MLKKIIIYLGISISSLMSSLSFAQMDENPLGQTIQIYTRFHSFVGRPSWLLMIRDVDHNENIPYVFDIRRGTHFWVALTYGRNYLITASNLQFSPYGRNPYKTKKIRNFCNLESHGRIIRGKSLYITINGDLTPNTNTYTCYVSKYADSNFTLVNPAASD